MYCFAFLRTLLFSFCFTALNLNGGLFRSPGSVIAVDGRVKTSKEVDDKLLVQRLLKTYRRALKSWDTRGDSMWQSIFNQHHQAIDQVFKDEKKIKLASEILRDPSATNLFWGLDSLAISHKPEDAHNYAILCLDNLIRFGEAIGAIRLENPEYLVSSKKWDANAIVQKVEETLGQSLSFPNPYPKEIGAITPRGIVSYRAVQALYQAWRIKQLLKNVPNPRVLEIGAGLGRTAYYARQFGIDDYTIVDLPFTSVISGYFLGRTLGEDQIVFVGEAVSELEKKIKFLTPADFFDSSERYDLIINVDSLTEMDPNIARLYWERIRKNGNIFLSINHEANFSTVYDLVNEGSNRLEINRTPYWMRDGYTEELIRIQ